MQVWFGFKSIVLFLTFNSEKIKIALQKKNCIFQKNKFIMCTVSSAITYICIPKNRHYAKLYNKNAGLLDKMSLVAHYSKT